MDGTKHFKAIIKNFLDKRAEEDSLFREKYESSNRTIDDVVTYILNQVYASGCNGFSDDEIYSMAVHIIDEPDEKIGQCRKCRVVTNIRHELTEEEKKQQREIAIKEFRAQEIERQRTQNHRVKKVQTASIITPSLFECEL